MRAEPLIIAALALVATMLAFSLTGSAPGALLEPGTTNHVEITTTSQGSLDLVAGLVTEKTSTALGFSLDEAPATTGWVLLAPEGAALPEDATLTVAEDRPFEDPNGATWLSREVTIGETTAWVVPIQEPRHDPTLDQAYNFAAIIDTSQLDEADGLTATVHEDLNLEPAR